MNDQEEQIASPSTKYSQSNHIDSLIRTETITDVYLVNGIKLKGIIVSQDQYTILIGNEQDKAKVQMIYKHAVSTVQPAGQGTTDRRPR